LKYSARTIVGKGERSKAREGSRSAGRSPKISKAKVNASINLNEIQIVVDDKESSKDSMSQIGVLKQKMKRLEHQ
jgi:hypothetical protein